MTILLERAPAKVNLTLHVLGRRGDGYHVLESLVAFTDIADEVTLTPGGALGLTVAGDMAAETGLAADNLILRAARTLQAEVADLEVGRFDLVKRLPTAAGLGGGSSDAAAALRLLARLNGIVPDDPRLLAAARSTGADCTVCLDPRPSMMRGAGEQVERLSAWPALDAVLVNPRVAVSTSKVFGRLGLAPGAGLGGPPHPAPTGDPWMVLAAARNDLAGPARGIEPLIAEVERALASAGAHLVRMSGSGATVVGYCDRRDEALRIAEQIGARHPAWWVRPVRLGGAA